MQSTSHAALAGRPRKKPLVIVRSLFSSLPSSDFLCFLNSDSQTTEATVSLPSLFFLILSLWLTYFRNKAHRMCFVPLILSASRRILIQSELETRAPQHLAGYSSEFWKYFVFPVSHTCAPPCITAPRVGARFRIYFASAARQQIRT